MPTAGDWGEIAAGLSRALGEEVRVQRAQPADGGCINRSLRLDTSAGPFFVKLNGVHLAAMFAAEAAGLAQIAATGTVRVPLPIAWGSGAGQAWLALEFLALGRGDPAGERELGRQLARMHRHTAPQFGWTRDNTIGSTPQRNDRTDDWPAFWRECRLRPQLQQAARNGGGNLRSAGALLLDRLDALLRDHRPVPSLLHGDLWGGNAAFTTAGEPVIFDPAPYFGDREADLAMTELFGGFTGAFYQGYGEEWPLDPGYARRRDVYNLYHVLNHLNLFGGGYREQAQRMIERLLRAT